MVKMRNKLTGTLMWVSKERQAEYLEAGHTMAEAEVPAEPDLPAEPDALEEPDAPAEPKKKGQSKK